MVRFPPPFSQVLIVKHLCLSACVLVTVAVNSYGDIRFNRDIRPVLSTACNKCHGPDESHREADLRLDNADGIRHAFDGGLESEGWARITSRDPDG